MTARQLVWLFVACLLSAFGTLGLTSLRTAQGCPTEPIVSGGVVCVCLETVSPPTWECFPGPEQYDVNVEFPAEFPISLEE